MTSPSCVPYPGYTRTFFRAFSAIFKKTYIMHFSKRNVTSFITTYSRLAYTTPAPILQPPRWHLKPLETMLPRPSILSSLATPHSHRCLTPTLRSTTHTYSYLTPSTPYSSLTPRITTPRKSKLDASLASLDSSCSSGLRQNRMKTRLLSPFASSLTSI